MPLRLHRVHCLDSSSTPKTTTRCNSTSCHKAGFFHLRLPDAPNDFALLSPLDPMKELGDYTCFEHAIHWLFCPKCAVRPFLVAGEGEVKEKKVPIWKTTAPGGIGAWDGEELRKVWAPKPPWTEGGTGQYISVNAVTLEGGQEGLDLREWTEKKVVCYLDELEEKVSNSYERPADGGCY